MKVIRAGRPCITRILHGKNISIPSNTNNFGEKALPLFVQVYSPKKNGRRCTLHSNKSNANINQRKPSYLGRSISQTG